MLTLLIGTLFFLNGTVCNVNGNWRDVTAPGETEHWRYELSALNCNAPSFNQAGLVTMTTYGSGAASLDMQGYATFIAQPTDPATRQAFSTLNYMSRNTWTIRVGPFNPFGGLAIDLIR